MSGAPVLVSLEAGVPHDRGFAVLPSDEDPPEDDPLEDDPPEDPLDGDGEDDGADEGARLGRSRAVPVAPPPVCV